MTARRIVLVATLLVVRVHGGVRADTPPPAPAPTPTDAAPIDDQLAALADAPPTFDPAQQRATGFDHRIHDRDLIVSGKEALPCVRCHTLAGGKIAGRPGHDACFGPCHGAPPRAAAKIAVAADQVRVCSACHPGAALAARAAGKPARLTVTYPPYTIDRDFGLAMSHQAHATAPCETCHASLTKATAGARAPRKPAATPHARCTTCHPASAAAAATAASHTSAPPMTRCATCHPEAYGPASGPRMIEPALGLAGFDHARHRARAPASTCASCHVTIAATAGPGLDAPTTASCAAAGCHDGAAAFATTALCTRCHTRAPTQTWHPARPVARFSHEAHAPRIGDVACASCHGLDRRGESTAPDHAACASCHAADFTAASPEICGACHVASDPWRPLIADRGPPPETEFGARLSHATHTGACAGCHRVRSDAREMRPPRGHASCTGDGCHQVKGGPTPSLADCGACHVLGLVADRTRDRLAAPWSVRARFRHDRHTTDAVRAPLACTACHGGMSAATSLAAVPAPRKPACAPCHDGAVAFKLTGTDCARCHGAAP